MTLVPLVFWDHDLGNAKNFHVFLLPRESRIFLLDSFGVFGSLCPTHKKNMKLTIDQQNIIRQKAAVDAQSIFTTNLAFLGIVEAVLKVDGKADGKAFSIDNIAEKMAAGSEGVEYYEQEFAAAVSQIATRRRVDRENNTRASALKLEGKNENQKWHVSPDGDHAVICTEDNEEICRVTAGGFAGLCTRSAGTNLSDNRQVAEAIVSQHNSDLGFVD